MGFRLVPKLVTLNNLERRNGVILTNLVVSGANCVKVVEKAITMDNLRLLCLAKNDANGINSYQIHKFKT